MFPIVVALLSMIGAWKWGDWRNWQRYLPTIQYFIGADMLYNLLCQNYLLWKLPHPPNVFPNHLMTSLFIMFTVYPSFLLVYLYHYPENGTGTRQLLYMLIWVVVWLGYELYMVLHGLVVYQHGWAYAWSIAFVCAMVSMARLHYVRPLWAYALSVPITVFLLIWFHVPILATWYPM